MNFRTAPSRAWAHLRELWPRGTFLPIFGFAGWPAYCVSRGEYRWEFVASVLFGAVLPYVGPKSKRLFLGILPIGLLGLFYDWMRFVKNVGLSPDRIHICDLRAAEVRWFGIQTGGARTTMSDYFQTHARLWLDVLCSIPYGTFLEALLAFSVILYFTDYARMQRFGWSILAMNVAGFLTYHLYPAAPPWYFQSHGCVADLAARASEGPNLARVDAWLGVPYFQGFYGRSNDIFGAIPSLHVAYPLLMTLEGWHLFGRGSHATLRWITRCSLFLFFVWMCFAAVYLDHHWVIDVLFGIAYAVAAFSASRVFSRAHSGTVVGERGHRGSAATA